MKIQYIENVTKKIGVYQRVDMKDMKDSKTLTWLFAYLVLRCSQIITEVFHT